MARVEKPKPQPKVEQPTVASKPKLPEARFSKLLEQIHADREKGMSLIETARTHFELNDGQQSILADWEAVL
jgi:hypothetical protein